MFVTGTPAVPAAVTEQRLRLHRAYHSPLPVSIESPAVKDWQTRGDTNETEIRLWAKSYPFDDSTGIRTVLAPALNINISNPLAADAVEELARQYLGDRDGRVQVRFGEPPRRLLLFCLTGVTFKSMRIALRAPNDAPDLVAPRNTLEFLCDGDQVVAFGNCPTGRPYSWFDNSSPDKVPRRDLLRISHADADAILGQAAELLIDEFGFALWSAKPEATKAPPAAAKPAGAVLSWQDIERLTGGRPGVSDVRCPYCMRYSLFYIERTLAQAQWRCRYCGKYGTTRNPANVAAKDERAARHALDADIAKQRDGKRQAALDIWKPTIPLPPTALLYFRNRGIEPPPKAEVVVRWRYDCPMGVGRRYPCIVALYRDVLTNEPTGILRTLPFPPPTWPRSVNTKLSLGSFTSAAIKLWPLAGDTLAVGEGIETVLSAVALGYAKPPAWALSAAGNLGNMPVIPGVRNLLICADNDANHAGQDAAARLFHRYKRAGRNVRIAMPKEVDTDFNDVLRKREGRS
jgi:hypothetical protein